ncbi:MAG: RHS repeat-associated core domain-containing protein [Bacteroidota bacterium]
MKSFLLKSLAYLILFNFGILQGQQLTWKENTAFQVIPETGAIESDLSQNANAYMLSQDELYSIDTGFIEITSLMLNNSSLSVQSELNTFSMYFTFENNFSLASVHQNSYSITLEPYLESSVTKYAVVFHGPEGEIDRLNDITPNTSDIFRIEKTENNKLLLTYNTTEHLITDNFMENGKVALYTSSDNFSFTLNNSGFKGVAANSNVVAVDVSRNWIRAKTYDNSGTLKGASINYFDRLGKGTQSQTKDYETNKTWVSETRYDYQGRPALQTFSAPLEGTPEHFSYKSNFITHENDHGLTKAQLNADPENPPLLDGTPLPGTLNWYYGESNTLESYQDVAEDRPYTRTIYDELNPGGVRGASGGKELDANANGADDGFLDRYPQGFSYTFPAAQELYYLFGQDYFEGPISGLGKEVVLKSYKTVSQDAHGNEVVSFSDAEGKVLAIGRSGGNTSYEVVYLIGEQKYVDIHYPQNASGGYELFGGAGSGYRVYDLRTGLELSNPGNMAPGNFYRIEWAGGTFNDQAKTHIKSDGQIKWDLVGGAIKGIRYNVNYYDFSINYYNEAGSLTATTQPLGFDSAAFNLETGTPNHTMATTFTYNGAGELTNTSSPDEGSSEFIYRSDGQIRFSRNSQQVIDQEFSYTNYDDLGRPVESGVSTSGLPFFETLSTTIPTFVVQSRLSTTPGEVVKSGVNTSNNSGFISNEGTGTGNFRISFQFSKDGRGTVGISETNLEQDFNDHTSVEYGMYFRWNQVNVMNYGAGLTKSATIYDENDVFQIERIGQNVYFKKNDQTFYTLSLAATTPSYLIDGQLFQTGSVVSNIQLEELDANFIPAPPSIDDWVVDPATCAEQVFTVYDVKDTQGLHDVLYPGNLGFGVGELRVQQHLTGNVSKTYTKNPETTTTWYSYDVYGRVEWIVQHVNGLGAKTLDYEYDESTGEVTKVLYQKGEATERFTHKYQYNDIGQLKIVETSRDNINYMEHARYTYYKSGELKRIILAQGLQGIDYVYTLDGRLKSINNSDLSANDPGNDTNNAFGLILDYYEKDYSRNSVAIGSSPSGYNRFDGNIKGTRWATQGLNTPGTQNGYLYQYNGNKWLSAATFGSVNGNIYTSGATPDFSVSGLTYDPNGNIQSLTRTREYTSGGNVMDNLQYNYLPNSNQLGHVDDTSGNTAENGDIKDQNSGNYVYNSIGQLIENVQDQLGYSYYTNGLVKSVYSTITNDPQRVEFYYNDRGHRVEKRFIDSNNDPISTFYVRDISGQVLAIHTLDPDGGGDSGMTSELEFPIYGASRLGVGDDAGIYKYELTDHLGNVRGVIMRDFSPQIVYEEDFASNIVSMPPWHGFTGTNVTATNEELRADVPSVQAKNGIYLSFNTVAHRSYSISFDLGLISANSLSYGVSTNTVFQNPNVTSQGGSITFQYTSLMGGPVNLYFGLNNDGAISWTNIYTIDNVVITDISTNNTPIMLAYKDYYPFGMPMPERNQEGEYRYAFQGQEKDDETGMEAFELRLWDARLGRWLTTDPAKQHFSPYLGMGNNPISRIDPDGGMDCPDPPCYGRIIKNFFKNLFTFGGFADSEQELIENQQTKQFVSDTADELRENGLRRVKESLEVSANGQIRLSVGNQIAGDIEGVGGFEAGHHSAVLFDLDVDLSFNIIDGFENNSELYYLNDDTQRLVHRVGYDVLAGFSVETVDNLTRYDNSLINSTTTMSEKMLLIQASQDTNNNVNLFGIGSGISIGAFFVADINGGIYLRNRR